jgi:hypothetical protein
MVTIANKRWISIRNIIIYLESKFRRNRRIFVFWRPPNTKILRFGQNWFPSRLWCCKLIIHCLGAMLWSFRSYHILLLLLLLLFLFHFFSLRFCPTKFSETDDPIYTKLHKIQKSSDLKEIWLPSRLWCCELISIVGLLCWPFCQWSPISMKIDI